MDVSNLVDLVAEVNSFSGLQDAYEAFFKLIKENGNSNYSLCYIQMKYVSAEKPLTFVHNRLPEKWQNRYAEKKYHLIDPTWEQVRNSSKPVYQSTFKNTLKGEQKAFIDDAHSHGLASGILIPYRGHTGTSMLWILSPDEETPKLLEELQHPKLIAYELFPFLFEKTDEISFRQEILSARESQVLYYLAEGLRTSDISEALNLAGVTVEKHVKTASKKLGAKNRCQAVIVAKELGMLKRFERDFDFNIYR